MTKLTPELEFKILQQCSNHFLICPFPDGWEDMTDVEQDEFIRENAWQPLENATVSRVYELIDDAATVLTLFLVDQGFVEEGP